MYRPGTRWFPPQEGTYHRDEELLPFPGRCLHPLGRTKSGPKMCCTTGSNSSILRNNVQVRDTTQQIHIWATGWISERTGLGQGNGRSRLVVWEIDGKTNRRDSLFLHYDTLLAYTSTYGKMDSWSVCVPLKAGDS